MHTHTYTHTHTHTHTHQGLVKQEELTGSGLSQQLRQLGQLGNADAAKPTKQSSDSGGSDSEKLERALEQMSQVLEDAKEFLKKQKKPLRADGSKAHHLKSTLGSDLRNCETCGILRNMQQTLIKQSHTILGVRI